MGQQSVGEREDASPRPIPDRVLTSGEQILAASDRASAPLTCGLFVQTTGRMDPARLQLAARTVIRRHPMARAVLYGSRQHAWRFTAEPATDPFGFLADGNDGWRVHEIMSSAPFDLRSFLPVRIALVRRPDGDQISVVAHHLAVDGTSLAAIVAEVLADYRSPDRPTPDRPTPDRPTPDSAARKVHRGIPAGVLSPARAAGPGWVAFARRSGRHITPLASGRSDGFGFHPLTLPVPPRRVELPDGRRMTVNDLLLAATHLTVDRWNARRGREPSVLRIRMPINLASSLGASGNHAGQTLVVTEPADRADLIRLATTIVNQTAQAKQDTAPVIAGRSGAAGLAAADLIPGAWRASLLRWGVATARPILAPTTAVSNLGRLTGLIGLDLGPDGPAISSVYFTGTAGMPQGLFIGVTGHGESLHLTLGYHRQLFSPGAAAAFAEMLQTSLRDLTDLVGPDPDPDARPRTDAETYTDQAGGDARALHPPRRLVMPAAPFEPAALASAPPPASSTAETLANPPAL